jgi:tetratricopeptide (TPR) repeat protein
LLDKAYFSLHQKAFTQILVRQISLFAFTVALFFVVTTNSLAAPFTPSADNDIVETLLTPSVRRSDNKALKVEDATKQAMDLIKSSREQADPRPLGLAKTMLSPWWDKPDAPTDVLLARALIDQGWHEFDDSRRALQAVLKRDPKHAQAWIELATVERVVGNFEASLKACDQVAAFGSRVVAAACTAEIHSMRGDHAGAKKTFELLRTAPGSTPDLQAWLLILIAEAQERAGDDAAAMVSFKESLAIKPDRYAAIALADTLLRNNRPQDALVALKNEPESEGAQVRRAWAMSLTKDAQLPVVMQSVQMILDSRYGRNPNDASHDREASLYYWKAKNNLPEALRLAKRNLTVQKEPADLWLLAAVARAANDAPALAQARDEVARVGLKDARIESLLK